MAKNFAEIGALIREERQRRQLRLDDVAKSLKIRANYLEAIEEGRFRDLPGPIYSFGYLKLYSDLLDLHDDGLFKSFRVLMEAEFFEDSITLQGDPYNHELKPSPKIVFMALLLLVPVYFFWYYAIYSSGRADKGKYTVLKEKELMQKAKELYGVSENQ